jgi:16S rRNA (adenine1518-N6/adenine1519-N6)-dimethyltransferase
MNTGEILKSLDEFGISPNKKLGQNFLCNQGIIDRIIECSSVNKNDSILEIGSGLGILTESLSEKAGRVTAVEIDSGLFRFLSEKFKNRSNIELIHADFLKLAAAGQFSKSISNLPYYCATEMLFTIAIDWHIPEVYVMLQREMAERIESKPGTKNYGAITAVLGLYYEPKILFNIDKRSFYPQPDVDSCYLSLKKRDDIQLKKEELQTYHLLVKSAFWGRRKTILKALSDSPHIKYDRIVLKKCLVEANIDDRMRGEMLSIEDFKTLTRIIFINNQQ